ncbi:MAG: ATP-binding cassette domain-containing protein, partial [Anaerolineae bacterium]|nr:ATP-binding cassette domain-containing protein [Anaerolineae bacterium]NIN97242.1 ATP-binding cassette domain-containing protein [Anaerolineae bacterium]
RRPIYVHAVDGVSLSLRKGETLAIVGESGCGKTTLGRTILRLLDPIDGRIVYNGKEITNLAESDLRWLRRSAQLIPQDPYSSLNPGYPVYKILEEPLTVHGMGTSAERRELVTKSLEDVHLVPPDVFLPKFPHMLSGGQRQRVAVARALILRPELIVADEPVSMLDASVRISILNLLEDLQQKYGISFIYITHDLATARHFSDRIGIMYAGELVEVAPSDSLLKEPLHPYTKALMDAIPDPDPANRLRARPTVPGEPPSLAHPPPGCRFHPRCPIAKSGLCDVEVPDLRELRIDHYVACHLAE